MVSGRVKNVPFGTKSGAKWGIVGVGGGSDCIV